MANNEVVIRFRADGGNLDQVLKQLQEELGKLGSSNAPQGIKSTSDALTRLAGTLGSSYKSAQDFAGQIGLTAEKAAQAATKISELDKVGASSAQKFAVLSKELGLTRQQFDALNRAASGQNTSLRQSSESVSKLAQTLGTSSGNAKAFAQQIGLTASKANEAVTKLRSLDAVGATNAEKFRALSREMGITRQQFEGLTPAASRSREAMTAVGAGAAAVALSLGAIGAAGIKSFAAFEGAINTFGVVTQSVGTPALAAVRQEIERLSAATTKTPQEIANVSVELGKAGFTADQTKQALAGVVLASEATGEGLARTGEVVGSTLTQFGLAADQSGKIADLLTTASNVSAAGTNDLGEALSYVGTQARASNQSVESTITTLAQLANAGIKGSSAGTGLTEALRRLKIASAGASTELDDLKSRGSKNAVAAFDRLNAAVRGSDGQLKQFPELVKIIKGSLTTLEQGDKDLLMNALFGVQGGRTIESLLGQTEEKLGSVSVAMDNYSGTAAEASGQLTKGLGPSFTLLGSSLDLAKQKVGEFLAVGVTPLVQAATGLVNAFISLPPAIQLPILAIGTLAGAISAAIAVGTAYELLQINTKAALFISTAATLADSAAKSLQTGATIAASASTAFYSTQLNLSTLAAGKDAIASGALAVAKGILAAATGTATTSLIGFGLAVAPVAVPVALLVGSVGLLVNTFSAIGRQASKQKSGMGDFDTALQKLNETQLKNQGATLNGVAADSVKIASNKRLEESVGSLETTLDKLRGKIGLGTAVETAANESKIAFNEVLATADTVQGRLQTVFVQKDLTKVSQQELADLNVALEASKKAIEATQPADAADAKSKEVRIKSLERLKVQLDSVKKAQENQLLKKEGDDLRKDPTLAADSAKTARLKEIDAQLKALNDKEKKSAEIQALQLKITEAKARLSGANSEADKKNASAEVKRLTGELDRLSSGAKTEKVVSDKDKKDEIRESRDEQKRVKDLAFEDSKQKKEQAFQDAKQQREQEFQDAKQQREQEFQDAKAARDEQRSDAKAARDEQRSDAKAARDEQRQLAAQGRQEAFDLKRQASEDAFRQDQESKNEQFAKKQQADQEAFINKQSEEKKKFNEGLSEEEKKIKRQQQLRDADPKERANLQKQFKKTDRNDKELEPLEKKKEEFEKKQAEEKKKEEERVKAEKALEESLKKEEEIAFKRQQREEEKAFKAQEKAIEKIQKDEDRAIEKAQKEEDRAIAKAQKDEDRAIDRAFKESEKSEERAFKESEKAADRAFKAEQQSADRAFKEAQRQFDLETARQTKAVLESTKIPAPEPAPATPAPPATGRAPQPRFLGGDAIAGNPYAVGERGHEIFVPATDGYFLNHQDSMRLARQSLSNRAPLTQGLDSRAAIAPSMVAAMSAPSQDPLLAELRELRKVVEDREQKISVPVKFDGPVTEQNFDRYLRLQRSIIRGGL